MSHAPEAKQLTFKYKNWRGDVATRTVIPDAIWFGVSEWHPEPQWFMRATDVSKREIRDFALLDITFLTPEKIE